MHIPNSMDDEWTCELFCKTHKCTALQVEGEVAFKWKPGWQMFLVQPDSIHCPKKDEFNGECWFMLLTDAGRYVK